ncbi:MAG: NAD(+)/NADH kinase [Solirubrobacterales bacterium]
MLDRLEAPRPIRHVDVCANGHAPGRVEALRLAREIAGPDIVLQATPREAAKFGEAGADLAVPDGTATAADLCLAFGGDGTILRALRRFAGTQVPVFAVNFGKIGFLAATEADDLADGLQHAFQGRFEVMPLPALELRTGGHTHLAVNDVTFARAPQGPVAELAYALGGEEVGHVRCDGLVAATPAGSTGYNLANGGPVMAWGVAGFAVSFVAPHTLTARALVVAPDDVLHVRNAGGREPVSVSVDGVHVDDVEKGVEVDVQFRDAAVHLAQMPGSNFYHRIREKFGRLAQ